ncbi:hypothetical protein [Massilia sp. CCM 8734]|uniref:hypothetical protein n=1 Tax=Massilia sp. CCM 8734 TaxID=2609283 RepID=UPI00141EF5AB|nr:hypothetical protein [Massilia sp. CCM 8734]NHZ94590.1 hypothetical protein [Massilia sp. CCM 8734]
MKERPILMNAPMVRALLDGSKTQTRRIMKPQLVYGDVCGLFPSWYLPNKARTGGTLYPNGKDTILAMCPYGDPGDQLWVRETFQPLFADGREHGADAPDWETGEGYTVTYPATDAVVEWIDGDDNITSGCKPSIHMPRWASRIQLEIVSVRVERLNDCSEADAKEEGINPATCVHEYYDGYAKLWNEINGAGSWESNPWVWVIELQRIKP